MKIECADCREEFESQVINISGVERPLSPYCLKCRKIRRDNYDEMERQEIIKQEEERKRLWIKQSNIPLKYQSNSFDDFIKRPGNSFRLKNICEEYSNEFPLARNSNYKSFIMFSKGVWGVGKTHLACAIGKRVMERWNHSTSCPVYYTTESALFLRIRSTYNKESEETEELIYKQLLSVPLLIIDDVGKEEVSDPRFVQRVWFQVVNGRYDNMNPIVLTANLDSDGLPYHLGGSRNNEAVWDRLLEMTGSELWEVLGSSYRR